jgi:8-oxo-dGTP pyrophosphatase MutT (NUDIX family)
VIEGQLRSLRAARSFEPQGYLPMFLGGQSIGWIRRALAVRLLAWPDLFEVSEKRIQLRPAEEAALSAAFAQVAQALARDGIVRGWRGETYAIRPCDGGNAGGAALFHLERAAVRFFGLTSSAAHLNGFFLRDGKPTIWIARRAAMKATDPGMLDNLVAGGVPSGEDAWRTLLRECGEEAGIPAALAAAAQAAGTLQICREAPEGLNSEILHVYDLALPADFAPRNVDGEVSEFQPLDARRLIERMAGGEMTVAAGLVTADFALRHGMLQDEKGKVRAAIEACRVITPP